MNKFILIQMKIIFFIFIFAYGFLIAEGKKEPNQTSKSSFAKKSAFGVSRQTTSFEISSRFMAAMVLRIPWQGPPDFGSILAITRSILKRLKFDPLLH